MHPILTIVESQSKAFESAKVSKSGLKKIGLMPSPVPFRWSSQSAWHDSHKHYENIQAVRPATSAQHHG